MTVPNSNEVAGSGLRAAAALGPGRARLLTAVDGEMADAAGLVGRVRGLDTSTVERDQPVRFHYFTPVSPPSIDGPAATFTTPLIAADDTVLLFGMVEAGNVSVDAACAVVDPQRPRDLTALDLSRVKAGRLVIVANARETRALSGGIIDVVAGAQVVRRETGADAVVVKDSARGCVVVSDEGAGTRIGPYPTVSVWPLGSGDVFAAAFAHALDGGAEYVEAARIGSNSAAWWCGTRDPVVPADILNGDISVGTRLESAGPELLIDEEPPVVYLAGPFFTVAERWLVETCRNVLLGLGARVFSPIHDVGPGGDEVASRDLEGLNSARAVLALLDGWDAGTVYEVGWAHKLGLPVVGFLDAVTDEGTKMLVGSGAELHRDLSTALYRSVWAAQGHPILPTRLSAP